MSFLCSSRFDLFHTVVNSKNYNPIVYDERDNEVEAIHVEDVDKTESK